jgi:hypothetical protein
LVREFIVGTGGVPGTARNGASDQPGAECHNARVVKITLHSGSYSWQFINDGEHLHRPDHSCHDDPRNKHRLPKWRPWVLTACRFPPDLRQVAADYSTKTFRGIANMFDTMALSSKASWATAVPAATPVKQCASPSYPTG